jgi:hypothetical protein
MKKILLTTILAGSSLAAFGQGGVVIANGNNNSAHWNLVTSTGAAAPIGTDVQLLWFNGSSFQVVGTVLTTTAGNAGTFAPNGGLYFTGTQTTQLPTYAATGTFEVQGWTGGFANYAAAVAGGAYVGQTASFTAAEANLGTTPAGTPGSITPSGAATGTQWNGDLVLVVPEPSTIALGGLGAAALLLFRRKK